MDIQRGDDYSVAIAVKDENAAAIDITGWKFWITIKSNESDADGSAVVQKAVTSHDDPTNGLTTVSLSNSDTDSLLGKYFYDIQFKKADGKVKTLMYGVIDFKYDYTRTTS